MIIVIDLKYMLLLFPVFFHFISIFFQILFMFSAGHSTLFHRLHFLNIFSSLYKGKDIIIVHVSLLIDNTSVLLCLFFSHSSFSWFFSSSVIFDWAEIVQAISVCRNEFTYRISTIKIKDKKLYHIHFCIDTRKCSDWS